MKITKAEVVWTPVQHHGSVGTIRIERRGYKSGVYTKGYSTWIDNRPLKNRGCLT